MIDVFIHKSFESEKRYVINYLFKDLLEVEYKINYHDNQNYFICFNNKKIEINNCFFSNPDLQKDYYKHSSNLPDKHQLLYSDFALEKNIPVIFGDTRIEITNSYVFIGSDIIAGIFFLLTLWEEVALNSCKDEHGRFNEKQYFLIQNNLHHRPVVNEYAEFIFNLMCTLSYKPALKTKKFRAFITHDVDDFARYDSVFKYFKAIGGDLIRRKSIKSFISTNKDYYNIKFKSAPDSYNTFDYLMDISEKYGQLSRFYFIPGKMGEPDVRFDIKSPEVKKYVKKILDRGHIVGIHPSYDSFDNPQRFKIEVSRLKDIHSNILEGRQHFLRYKNPDTWQLWEENNLQFDSSIGYYNNIGFKAGVCSEYPIFDVVRKKQLNLRERPLIVMDTALRRISNSRNEALTKCKEMIKIVKKYNGDFGLLWHNSNLKINEWEGWSSVYEQIIAEF